MTPQNDLTAHVPFPTITGNTLKLTYRLNLSATDVTLIIQSSPDLSTWSTAPANLTTLSDDGQTRVIEASLPLNSQRQYLRLQVTH